VRRWRQSGLGDNGIAAKAALIDADLDALYDIGTWEDDCNTKDDVATNAVRQKIMCNYCVCCSCCALFNEAAAGSIYMTYL
jgi:hypothetical protein